MNQKIWIKVLATLLVMTLTCTNFILLGVYTSKSYATSSNLESQETVTNNENVTFNAYFKDEKGNMIHTVRENINKEDVKLYIATEVKKGYLKNAKVQVLGEKETDSNLKVKNSNEVLQYIETIDEESNTINLKQINGGTQIVLEIPVVASKEDNYNLSNFSKLNNIVLTGSYIGDNGKETKIQKTIQTRNEWTGEGKPVLDQQLLRFIPYQVGEKSGTIVQTLVRSGIENNALPIEETKITLAVPTINGKNPSSVNVIANGTLATNGMTAESFHKENWEYDNTTGNVTITVKNEASDNKISWRKNSKDEFILTYIFDEKVDTILAMQKATTEIKAYNSVETKISANHELTISQNEVLGQIVTGTMTTNEALSKGYLYTKSQRETLYNENIIVDISYPELVDELRLTQNADYFVNEKGEVSPLTIGNTNYAYYKTTKISKANFEKILGDKGTLKITTLDGTELVTFHNETVADENGNYVFSYAEEVNQIKIVTNKPVATGKLEITHEKVLKGNTDYSKAQVESFKTLKVMANIEAYAAEKAISKVEVAKEIPLVAPTTKIETQVSNANLSTVVTNENVELRAILKTNDISCDLYKNPTIEMVLPNYISKLNIKDINLLFEDELTIKDYNTHVNENGNIVITVNIQGEQTKYSGDEISKGANLIINTDITLKQLTPTKDDVIKVYVTNELVTTYEQTENTKTRTTEQRGYSQTALKAVAPVGMVTTNTISGYNAKNETVTSMSSQEQIGKLDVNKEQRTATVSMNIINNYQNVVKNVSILGRVPTAGNKNADTLEEFGSNLASSMASSLEIAGIDASNIEIYYSTSATATKEVSLTTNGWTKTPENLANVKSYLVVINGDIATGTMISMSYRLAIPEKVSYNMGAYSNYVVYFDNVATTGTTSEKAVATKVGLATGEGPELEVKMNASVENGKTVQEGNMIRYEVSVKNVGKTALQNVTLSGNIPQKTYYTYYDGQEGTQDDVNQLYDVNKKEYAETIASLGVGETKTISYLVEVQNLNLITQIKKDENGYIIYNEDGTMVLEKVPEDVTLSAMGKVTVEGFDAVFTSNEINHKVVQGYIKATMKVAQIPESFPRSEGDQVTYEITVENVNNVKKENVVMTNVLPEGLHFEEATDGGTYDENSRTVTWNIGTLDMQEEKTYLMTVTVEDLPSTQLQKQITNKVTIKTSEKEVYSNEITIKVQKAHLVITQTSDTKETVSAGDTIVYHVTVKNVGSGTAKSIKITDVIPEGVHYDSAQYSVDGKSQTVKIGSENAMIEIPGLNGGSTAEVTIHVIAENLENGMQKREVTNVVKVEAEGMSEILSNSITHTILAKQSGDNQDPSVEKPVEGTYSISGIAWLDSNQDGNRSDDEARLSHIPVLLINVENGKIVTDITTGKEKKQETNDNGEYVFANLKPGNYMVVFLYDSGNYGVTRYKQEGINDDKNSDAVQMNVVYEGISRIAATSDKLVLESENIGNIDIGLVHSPKFDLKLDKVISKITVSDANGTDVYDYKDTKLAKLDLNAKTANGSTIMIEYKIRITNEGGVAGYAKKIVDYIPSDMKFNSELNKDWYTSDNGTNLYNASLANVLIQPGETKEITLLLTKKITDSNMGIINNTAEIAESYNDLGLTDMDSTPANRVQNEDDYSSADAIIGTKTGQIYVYIALAISTVAILGVGIYFIKKKVLKRI